MEKSNYSKHTSRSPLKRFFIERYFTNLFNLLDGRIENNVLEVGCGEGFVLNRLTQKWPNINMLGIDINKEAITHGNKLFPKLNLEVKDLNSIKQKYDLVLCLEVLEHLDKPELMIKTIKDKTNNLIAISVPHEPWFNLLSPSKEHISHWGQTDWLEFLKKQGLTIVEFRRSFPWLLAIVKKND